MSDNDKLKEKLKTNEEISEFERLLNQYDYSFKKGDIVKGKVVGYESDDALIDIGAKTSARVPSKELTGNHAKSPQDILPVDGKEREFLIIRDEDEEGQLTLSYKKVAFAYAWSELERLKNEDAVVEAEVTSSVKGGILVDVLGLRGFVPSSHIRAKDTEELVGKKIQLKILSVDPKQNNLIMSHRKVISEQQAEQRKDLFDNIQIGNSVEGEVVRLADFGAFVDIGGIDGLLPLSQISWRWVDHPADILSVGEKIKVQVIGIDEEKQRVSLSLKSLQPDPWVEAAKVINEGSIIKGNIIRIKHFGAFVEIYPGVEALLPYKELIDYQNKTGTNVQVNQEIETIVLRFNPEDRRISLSTPVTYNPAHHDDSERHEKFEKRPPRVNFEKPEIKQDKDLSLRDTLREKQEISE
jgi:ribosomal protein S1